VIVRIATEGQFELPDADVGRLNELDNQAVAAVEAGDEPRFHQLWAQMVSIVENDGRRLDDDELVHSDLVMPPRDITFAEAKGDFSGEGLIPDGRP
jgi:hypothetical protein